ncbi:ribosomal protein S18 acetylase RimI-like enzyme [Luteibacter sp. Sphag1AF]|uniref:GNAT family N-acetyltransferase n=1 Tax=Luteibacter sp. Sphag1AF TaxID=2587031 RepID=UPI0016094D22|nr:GNAT family N-acetyltransferase [Luteibacter sp. Sphag1AF]MBB3226601.1 ribosomal protein S18 acetylase RimI-like enzyme [Luteibacter sp. Sphag1AF]
MLASGELSFPVASPDPWIGAALGQFGLSLRQASSADLPFLRRLYGQVRAPELEAAGWPVEARQPFVDMQFALQHKHYVMKFPNAHFLVVHQHGQDIGRIYVDVGTQAIHLIDIAIQVEARGHGVGHALIAWLQSMVGPFGPPAVTLYVEINNTAARRLYEACGFSAGAVNGHHLLMRWAPGRAD